MRNILIFILVLLINNAYAKQYIDYTKDKVNQLVEAEFILSGNTSSFNIDSIVSVYAVTSSKYDNSFRDHIEYYQVFVSCSDSSKIDLVVAINSALTIYRLCGFHMNDIMTLCTDIKKDIDYFYGRKRIFLSKELKKTALIIYRRNGSWYPLELYDLYIGMKKTSYDYKKYPLLDPGKERAIGYFIQRCDSKGKCYIQQK